MITTSAAAMIAAVMLPGQALAVSYGDNALDSCSSWHPGSGDPSSGGTLPTCSSWSSDSFADYSPWGYNYFTLLRESLYEKNGATAYERIFVPYDAVGYYNTSSGKCEYSPAFRFGGEQYNIYASTESQEFNMVYAGEQWAQLLYQLQQIKSTSDAAVTAGYGPLVPLLVLAPGTGIGQQPGSSMYNSADNQDLVPSWPDASNSIDQKDYACGVDELITAIEYQANKNPNTYPQVTEIEALNEPDGARYSPYLGNIYDANATADAHGYGGPYSPYNGSSPMQGDSSNGEWKAGYLWYILKGYTNFLHRTVSYVPFIDDSAYVGTHPNNNGYFDPYYRALSDTVTCQSSFECQPSLPYMTTQSNGPASTDYPTNMPYYWSVHDYEDPDAQCTACGTLDLQQFANEVAQDNYGIGPSEAGPYTSEPIWVSEAAVHLDEPTKKDQNYPNGLVCTGDGDNINGLGCLVDNNGPAQQRGAYDWLALGSVSGASQYAGYAAGTTELLWYQFQLQNGVHAFDSALLDASGTPRPSYCILVGSGTCNGNAADYETPGEPPGGL